MAHLQLQVGGLSEAVTVTADAPLLHDFVYRAVDPAGVVEHELCPVFAAVCDGDIEPNPAEVEEWRWVHLDEVLAVVAVAPWTVSPWMVAQVDQLHHADLSPWVRTR